MIDTPAVQFAIAAVCEAAQLTRRVQRQMVSPALAKSDKSPVTVADFSAQAIIAKRLGDAFPTAKLVGEEDACELQSTDEGRATLERVRHFLAGIEPDVTNDLVCEWIDRGNDEAAGEFWTLDPVDGTKGFLRGDQYVVALAFIEDGVVRLGVLACPELEDATIPASGGRGSVLVAARGEGAWVAPLDGEREWRRVWVTDNDDVRHTRIFRSVESDHTNAGQLGQLARAMGVRADPIPMDSQAKYAVLAGGGGEMLVRLLSEKRLDYREKIWDQAAGAIIVEEAGGRVTDLDSRPLDFSQGKTLAANRGVLATNGHVHDAALRALRAIGA